MFAEPELNDLNGLDDEDMRTTFFKYWTLREAYVKALGTGLGVSSKKFHFVINNDEAKIYNALASGKLGDVTEHWQFSLFNPTENHIASIAVCHSDKNDLNVVSRNIVP